MIGFVWVDKKIMVIFVGFKVKRGWYDWIEGWDRLVIDFWVLDVFVFFVIIEYSLILLGLFILMFVSFFLDDFFVILEDIISFYRVYLNNIVLFDVKGIISLSWKMVVFKFCVLLGFFKFYSIEEFLWWLRVVYLVMSFGVEFSFVIFVD